MATEILERCPLCDHSHFDLFLACKDWMSSQEIFELKKCQSCSFVFTNPRPDQKSIAGYYESTNYISHTRKSTGIVDSIYLIARNFTLRSKIRLLRKYIEPAFVLDYGCGTGEFLARCKSQHWQISGVEPATEARYKAAELTGTNIAENLPSTGGTQFDVITLWHVLEHVMELKSTLSSLSSKLKQGGLMFIAVPNHESHDAMHYQEFWAAYDVPRHFWHFTETTMARLLASEGLRIKAIEPMKLDAYYVSLLSEKYKSGNKTSPAVYFRGAARGLLSNRKARTTANYSSLIYVVTR